MNSLPCSGSAADELYESEHVTDSPQQSSVAVTRRTGVTTGKLRAGLESRCLEWLALFNLHQSVKYRSFKTRSSVFVSQVSSFSVCEKWPCLYCITTLTAQLNTFHTWIEIEAPLRGNWWFVDHFRTRWSSRTSHVEGKRVNYKVLQRYPEGLSAASNLLSYWKTESALLQALKAVIIIFWFKHKRCSRAAPRPGWHEAELMDI